MTKSEFNRKYGTKGGLLKFAKMMDDLESINSIAGHFGVSGERVRQWAEELGGSHYDPRKVRRDRMIGVIQSLLEKNSKEEIRKILPKVNKSYLREAIIRKNDFIRQRYQGLYK